MNFQFLGERMSAERKTVPVVMTLLLVPAFLAVGSCSTARPGPESSGSDAAEVEFAVRNDIVVPTSVSVFVVTEDGSEQLLGQVPAGTSRVLRFRPRFHSLEHRLRAETETGREIASTPFTLVGVSRVSWRLRTNRLELGSAPEGAGATGLRLPARGSSSRLP